MRIRVCRALEELRTLLRATALIAACGIPAAVSAAPTPAPHPHPSPGHGNSARPHVRVMRYVPPATPLHSEFIVETNKLGQVTHVRAGKPSKNLMFNSQTYMSAVMSFIRTPDGMHAVPGTYRLLYDYNPKTHMIKRGVTILRRGGVDPNALGAVIVMQQAAAKRDAKYRTAHPSQTPNLPNLNAIGIPSSAPRK